MSSPWPLLLLAALLLPACSAPVGTPDDGRGPGEAPVAPPTTGARKPTGPTPTAETSSTPPPTAATGSTPLLVTVDGQTVEATLGSSPAARELVRRLPLTLDFRDFNGVEKISRLPGGLPMDGMPEGDDPEPGDIGYYAPTGDLVLYYGDVGYFDGIARLGRMSSTDLLSDASGGELTVTLALAG